MTGIVALAFAALMAIVAVCGVVWTFGSFFLWIIAR